MIEGNSIVEKKSKAGILFFAIVCFEALIRIGVEVLYIKGVVLNFYISVILGQLMILIPIIVFMVITKTNPLKILPFKKIKLVDLLLIILATYLIVPLMMTLNIFSQLFAKNYIQNEISTVMSQPFLINYFFIAVIPAFFEEISFRGIFFHEMKRFDVKKAGIISALLFGTLHLNFNQFFYAAMLGIYFVFLVEATGSVFSSMIGHLIINGNSVIMLYGLKFLSEKISGFSDLFDSQLNTNAQEQIGIINILLLVGVFGMISIGTTVLAALLIIYIAKRNQREGYLKEILYRNGKMKNRIVTIPLIAGIIICFSYMIWQEFVI